MLPSNAVTVLFGQDNFDLNTTELVIKGNNNSPRAFTFEQSLDGPSPDLVNQRHRTSRFAPLFLTPPRHPIINSTNTSQVFGDLKTMLLRLKSPCLKKNDTLCQRYRKQQHSRMADTKSVSSETPMLRYRKTSPLQSNNSRK